MERTATDSSNREQDFYAWVLEQARRIRVNQPETVDWQGLATELDDLTLRTRHELLGHLEEVFIHLLKLQYERSDNQRRRNEWQWKVHLAEHRNRINDLLDDSRTLRNMFDDFKRKAYPRACKRAKLAMGLAGEFPLEPPWTDEKLLDDSFFPAAQRLHP
ncbi:MAG TPA: DUF29 domain-containing protein [Candidatus Binataceae bacterium]|nr:DUF29 domain-containing protein [Candidatus Binataceae bacterium]